MHRTETMKNTLACVLFSTMLIVLRDCRETWPQSPRPSLRCISVILWTATAIFLSLSRSLSLSLSHCLFLSLSLSLSFSFSLSVYLSPLSLSLSLCLSSHSPVCLSVSLPLTLSVCLSLSLSLFLSLSLPSCLQVVCGGLNSSYQLIVRGLLNAVKAFFSKHIHGFAFNCNF